MSRTHPHAATLAVTLVIVATASVAVMRLGAQHTDGAVRQFDVVARRFEFAPNRLEVTQGERVRIVTRSADGTHGIGIKKLRLEKYVPKGGEPVVLEFVAKEVGTFEIVCTEYCGRGHDRMKGVLVVGPATAR